MDIKAENVKIWRKDIEGKNGTFYRYSVSVSRKTDDGYVNAYIPVVFSKRSNAPEKISNGAKCDIEGFMSVDSYTDTGAEKHRPVVKREGDEIIVNVGSKSHPMSEEHAICWVSLITNKGNHRKLLIPGEEPVVHFTLNDELPLAVYSYCNLHGLWKTQI